MQKKWTSPLSGGLMRVLIYHKVWVFLEAKVRDHTLCVEKGWMPPTPPPFTGLQHLQQIDSEHWASSYLKYSACDLCLTWLNVCREVQAETLLCLQIHSLSGLHERQLSHLGKYKRRGSSSEWLLEASPLVAHDGFFKSWECICFITNCVCFLVSSHCSSFKVP